LVYGLIPIGVVNDSPILAIDKALIEAEPEGLSEPQLTDFIKAHPFVSSRFDALNAGDEMPVRRALIVALKLIPSASQIVR